MNQNGHLETSKNKKIIKIDQDYKQIWTAWIPSTWPLPAHSGNSNFCGLWQSLKDFETIGFGSNLLSRGASREPSYWFSIGFQSVCAHLEILHKLLPRHVASSMLTFAWKAPWESQFCSPNTRTIKKHKENETKPIAYVPCKNVSPQHGLSASVKHY